MERKTKTMETKMSDSCSMLPPRFLLNGRQRTNHFLSKSARFLFPAYTWETGNEAASRKSHGNRCVRHFARRGVIPAGGGGTPPSR